MKTTPPFIPGVLGFNPTGDLGPWTFYTAHDRRPVFFIKAPPLEPPTWKQRQAKQRFSYAAKAWRNLTPQLRKQWQLAAARAHLRITGYNLWVFYQVTHNTAAIRTIEHQSGVTLLPA